MLTREDLEKRELEFLAPSAAKSCQSKGRSVPEEKCAIRTEFQRDRDRIIHSKAFRRLMHKTQVFLAPEGDHFRTRLTHTIEVSQIARTIARGLNLNEDLTEAIALGHDLGHTPFGHNGEEVLNTIHPGGFEHNVQSLRVADVLEMTSSRKGMNLTAEVRDGIVNHTGSRKPFTLEGQVVKISDRVAYINHDIDDAVRSGVISMDDIPRKALETFGYSHAERINNMVTDIIRESDGKDEILQSPLFKDELITLRSFMFSHVYKSSRVKKEEDLAKVEVVIKSLYEYFLKNPDKLPEDLQEIAAANGINEAVKDYIAGMTDRFALNVYTDLFVPKSWK
ncbi:MAG: deoxyguanosinetriphosphate triphosphohydrolase [Candidatus Fimisoma sp.]|jgi:dGTPase|nr:deoxyguanosinetriphosphate triphosphohydrolase [Bacillota bacterium]MDD7285240.1 deoxyguanosinetriphosphate triphosphohydrolase [Bacillota bacterium]MDY4748664.1 deoxyguanosinetriphosphate triphosphohydrolase [Candidatus Fimisoma sp.]